MTNEMSDKYDANKCEAKWASRWIKDRTYTFDPKSKKESYIIDIFKNNGGLGVGE